MTQPNFFLVRSPNLINEGQVGYGWGNVNFSAFDNAKDLIEKGFQGINRGRHTKQIKRFFNIKKGDYVIVPFSGAIAIAEVIGDKTYHPIDKNFPYGENRIAVRYLKHKDGFFIPRKHLTTALQNRLKVRMTVCNLNQFSDDLNKHINSINNNTLYTWTTEQENKLNMKVEQFKTELLSRFRSNKNIYLKAGGLGLELIVKEILEAKGYKASIPGKNLRSGIEDVDIIATRDLEFSHKQELILIQVKHHKGVTNSHGVKQVYEYEVSEEDYASINRVLLTTAEFKNIESANSYDITVLAGIDFINWIYENLSLLSNDTLLALGISDVPTLL